jgi:hypothetical protein
MQCPETQTLFTDFADNTLGREELHTLTGHLLDCPSCALEWREFQQTLTLVHSIEALPPPADLLPGIHRKLAKRGIFGRAWALIEALNFSLSIPAAAAVFTIAMLAGFLLKNSPQEQPGIFPSAPAQVSALRLGEVPTPRRQPIAPNAMFAVSHNGGRQNENLEPLGQTVLATHPTMANDAHRLLSPDMHVLIADADHDSQVALFQEMLHRNWQIHRMAANVFLIHLPQTELEDFHELLGQHHFALMPAAAAQTRFGSDKKVLTAAIRFQ